jgi:hypothetical protein
MEGRKSAYWMKQIDERILETLDREGWSTPELMSQKRAFNVSPGQIWERCEMLRYVGFVDTVHDDMYELTTDGQLYLEGRIDARYRPKPTVDRVLRGRG